jgi:SAM-dependent methyltransferase
VSLGEQLARPRGLAGLLAGELLAWRNRDLNRWTLRLLGVGRKSRVLEVGFGPGVGVRLAAQRARRGLVAGVDPSHVMVERAQLRNRRAVRAGRVDLREGSVTPLPWPDATFTHAFAVNVFYEWEEPARALAELTRVLRPGGRLALTAQGRGATDLRVVGRAAQDALALLGAAGFEARRVAWRRARPLPAHCLLGTLPG